MSKTPHPTEDCPHCGEPVRIGAPACPHCGSDAETGWADAEEIAYQSVEKPDYYDGPAPPSVGWKRVWFAMMVVLAILALLRLLGV